MDKLTSIQKLDELLKAIITTGSKSYVSLGTLSDYIEALEIDIKNIEILEVAEKLSRDGLVHIDLAAGEPHFKIKFEVRYFMVEDGGYGQEHTDYLLNRQK